MWQWSVIRKHVTSRAAISFVRNCNELLCDDVMTFAVTLPMKCFRQTWGRNLCHFSQSRHSNVSASKQLGGIEGIFATKLTNEHNNAWSQPISVETGCDQHPVSDLYSSLRSLTSVMRGDKPIDATVTWSEASGHSRLQSERRATRSRAIKVKIASIALGGKVHKKTSLNTVKLVL